MVNLNKRIVIIYLGLIFSFASSFKILAQDFYFSQPTVSNVNINTALAGNDSMARLGMNFHYQPDLHFSNFTTSLNFYQFIPKLNAYSGIIILNNNTANGLMRQSSYSAFYSQNINIKQLLLRPSIEIGYVNERIDWSKISMSDPFGNSLTAPSIPDANYLNVNVGAIATYKNFLAGVSIHHINSPPASFYQAGKSPFLYGFQCSYAFNFKSTNLSPFLLCNQQATTSLITSGLNLLLFKHLNFMMSYRSSKTITSSIGYQNRHFTINYSYNHYVTNDNYSDLKGSHEICFALKFWKVKTKKRFIPVNSIFS